MQIISRIKKLEEKFKVVEPAACQCFHKHQLAMINQAYGEPYAAADILPEGTPIKGICSKCNKTIGPEVKEFYDMMELCYGGKNEH